MNNLKFILNEIKVTKKSKTILKAQSINYNNYLKSHSIKIINKHANNNIINIINFEQEKLIFITFYNFKMKIINYRTIINNELKTAYEVKGLKFILDDLKINKYDINAINNIRRAKVLKTFKRLNLIK